MGDGGREMRNGLDLRNMRGEWRYRVENRVSGVLGFVSLPTTVRNPPSERSSGSIAFSFVRTPTSTFEEAPGLTNFSFQVPSARS